MDIAQADMDVLRQAVDSIVASERERFPDKDDTFWSQFRMVLLADVLRRHKELLDG